MQGPERGRGAGRAMLVVGGALLLLTACPAGDLCAGGPCTPDCEGAACEGPAPDAGPGCRGGEDCPASAPVCEAGTCRPCARDADCGPGRACAAGACASVDVACVSDADCGALADRPRCDTVHARCVACTRDTDCTGLGQSCDGATGRCVTPTTCTDDADCADPSRPRCDAASGACVACRDDGDCAEAGARCDPAAHVCLAFVPCTSDAECAGDPGGARCDLVSGTCVACVADGDCAAGTGRTCGTDHVCAGGTPCAGDGDCAGTERPRCDPDLGLCVTCLEAGDCGVGARCDPVSRTCPDPVPCAADGDCAVTGRCDPVAGVCVECRDDAPCASPAAVCVAGLCDTGPPEGGRPGAACAVTGECAAASALPPDQGDFRCLTPGDPLLPWGWHAGYCIGLCSGDEDCPAGSACLGGGCWDRCETDAECRPGYGCQALSGGGASARACAPRCDPALADAVACSADADCPLGVCDLARGRCACSPVGGRCAGLGRCLPGGRCWEAQDAAGAPTPFTGGYCVVPDCDPPAVPCPEGSACYTLSDGARACLKDCDPNDASACGRPGYGCAESLRWVLGGACRTSADCPDQAPDCVGASALAEGTCVRTCATGGDCDASEGHVCTNLDRRIFLCADPFQTGACLPGCTDDAGCGRCAVDGDCAEGGVCSGGVCRRPCTSAADCRGGEVCAGGVCALGCVDATDCPRGAACEGGACTEPPRSCDPVTARCDPPCTRDLDCDRVRTCDPDTARCETPCTGDAACGPVGRCDGAEAVCRVDCRVRPEACPEGTRCDPGSGACL